MRALKEVHTEIVQNIENKYIGGLEDAMEALNKVNEEKNQYKTDHLTYQKTEKSYINNGMVGQIEQTTTQTKYFTLSDILNSPKVRYQQLLLNIKISSKLLRSTLKNLKNLIEIRIINLRT